MTPPHITRELILARQAELRDAGRQARLHRAGRPALRGPLGILVAVRSRPRRRVTRERAGDGDPSGDR